MSRTSEAANDEAVQYLSTLLNRTLHIHIADGRMFEGTMKCTDKDRNVILTLAREHRRPSRAAVARAAEDSDAAKFSLPMERRYVGQVVIPGQYITRVELAG